MIIRAIKLRVVTERGDFGFAFTFSRNLTIVRASNSSGKSTLFNSILYALGMEEIIGGKGEKTLPYAVKDHFEYEESRINIAASEVFIEIENRLGNVITLRRAIHDSFRETKLVEVFSCAHLTKEDDLGTATPTYLHDAGGAVKKEGFHRYLEIFLGLKLPQVPTTTGGEAKLYLQAVFAALAVEQKRGWTDYIANIPFYGIRDARTRVVEYLLGLSVFETNAKRNRLNAESIEIDNQWRQAIDELRRETNSKGVSFDGVPSHPTSLFDPLQTSLKRHAGPTSIPLDEYIAQLRIEYSALKERSEQFSRSLGAEALKEINAAVEELQELSVVHERTSAMLGMNRSSLREYETLLNETQEDLERNKTAAKLRDLGAKHGVELATGHCPTCHQTVADTLLSEAVTGPQMDLATNIGYLESQSRMLQRQLTGLREAIIESEARRTELSTRLAGKHDYVNAMRGDMSSGASESKAIVRRQVQIEIEIEGLRNLTPVVNKILESLVSLAARLAGNQSARKVLPKNAYTVDDNNRISIFQKQFRANAGSFGYESAPIQEVEISPDTLVPCLAQLELREIRTDIKSDSSASDFVRLIWSYLLALQQTSAEPSLPGNHPGILLLDEPGQHSMAVDSQHALLQQLAIQPSLQSIVAASFDEADAVFNEATQGVKFKLIQWHGKLLRPL